MNRHFVLFFTASALIVNSHAGSHIITDNGDIHAPWVIACQVWVPGWGWQFTTIDKNDPKTQEMFAEVHH